MSEKVIQIVRPTVDPKIVEVLEEHLANAKAGKLRGIAVCIVTTDHEIGGDVVASDCFASMLAALTCTQHDLIEEVRQA